MVYQQVDGIAEWDKMWERKNGQLGEKGQYAAVVCARGPVAAILANRQEDI